MIDSDLFLSPSGRYCPICTSGARLRLEGSKMEVCRCELEYSGFSELPVLGVHNVT